MKKNQAWLPHHPASHRPAGCGYGKEAEAPAAGCDVKGDPECPGYAGRGSGPKLALSRFPPFFASLRHVHELALRRRVTNDISLGGRQIFMTGQFHYIF